MAVSRAAFLTLFCHTFTLTVLHVDGSLPEYCGKETDSYTPLRKTKIEQKYTLKQVHVVMRHGDRTKIGPEPCWANDSAQWDCLLTTGSLPVIKHDTHGIVVDRIYRDVYMQGRNDNPGDCGSGHLTFKGYQQQELNGQILRKAYDGLLSPKYSNQEVFLRSDDESRTRQSAQSLALGLFPPFAPQFGKSEVIDINVMDKDYDDIEPNALLCPKLGQYEREFFQSDGWLNHYNKYTKPLIKDIQQALGITRNLTMDDLRDLADCLLTHICHDYPIPSTLSSNLLQRLQTEMVYMWYSKYSYPSIDRYSRVGIGFLIKEIWQAMQESMEGGKTKKFYLYSGHDNTVMPFLQALNASDGKWTPYAAMVQLELYQAVNSTNTDYAVRLLYKGQERRLPYCDDSPCAIAQFSKYINTIIPHDHSTECAVSTKPSQPGAGIRTKF